MDNLSNVILTDTEGATTTLVMKNSTDTSSSGVIGGDGVNTAQLMAQRIAQAVNATPGKITASPTDGSSTTITLTQDILGVGGNAKITTTNANPRTTLVGFSGGKGDEENKNCLWQKDRKERPSKERETI